MTSSQLGLALDILGAIIIFFFGLPSRIIDPNSDAELSTGPPTENERAKRIFSNRFITIMAYLGLFLIFLGFVFQFIGTFKRSC